MIAAPLFSWLYIYICQQGVPPSCKLPKGECGKLMVSPRNMIYKWRVFHIYVTLQEAAQKTMIPLVSNITIENHRC